MFVLLYIIVSLCFYLYKFLFNYAFIYLFNYIILYKGSKWNMFNSIVIVDLKTYIYFYIFKQVNNNIFKQLFKEHVIGYYKWAYSLQIKSFIFLYIYVIYYISTFYRAIGVRQSIVLHFITYCMWFQRYIYIKT